MSDHIEGNAINIAAALIADPGAAYNGGWNDASLWRAARMLAKLVKDAKPIVESDAVMMAAITRHAPLPSESQFLFDATKSASEQWIDDIEAIETSSSANSPKK